MLGTRDGQTKPCEAFSLLYQKRFKAPKPQRQTLPVKSSGQLQL